MSAAPDVHVARACAKACRLDVIAFKPGNVSLCAAGHGMDAQDFLRSAAAAVPALCAVQASLGERIEGAVRATQAAVGINTNLGIVLLLAPLAAAAAHGGSLRAQVAVQLAQTSVADARACYRAIRMARPAGLGQVPEQDVAHEPAVDLTAAMRLAAAHDRIARQYANTFADVFEHGVPILEAARTRHRSLVWSTTACYLHLLGNGPDSHIERKYGHAAASAVSRRARAVETALKACENPRAVKPLLMAFDRELKARGINPGTSADLTVASVMAYLVMQRASGECTS